MELGDVMEEIAAAAGVIEGLRCFAYPPDKISPPTFMTALPESIDFDGTYGRGMDTLQIPGLLVVGRMQDRSSVLNLVKYLGGSGPLSIKQAIEAFEYTSCDYVHVKSAAPGVFTFGQVDHLGVDLSMTATGSGA
jgi:hypothetical protein